MCSHFLIFHPFFFLRRRSVEISPATPPANLFMGKHFSCNLHLTVIHLFGLELKNRRLSPRDAQGHDTFLVNHTHHCHAQSRGFRYENGWIASKGKKEVHRNAFRHGKAAHCDSRRLLKLRSRFQKSGTEMEINWAQMMFASLLIGNYPSNDFVEKQLRKWIRSNLRKSCSGQTGWTPVWLRAGIFSFVVSNVWIA